MEEINLHFTGDLHAISTAHNLLAAAIDNHLHQNREPELNPRDVAWKRVIDMNDRSLRQIINGMGSRGFNGVMREDGFEITAASEVMAVLCLARDLQDLKARLGRIITGYSPLRQPIHAADIGVHGAMTALLKNAINPNLVQTIEGTPVFVHGGPFANIAHGCNSLIATRMALKLSDYTVTEAGFGADLGAEKFFDIKCRKGGLTPRGVVLVVTNRACKLHGIENIEKHVENLRLFGVPVVISINRFLGDSDADLAELKQQSEALGIPTVVTDCRENGGEGAEDLARAVVAATETESTFKPLYDLNLDIADKVRTVAEGIYGAANVEFSTSAKRDLKRIQALGYGDLPVCMAKTPASFSDDPKASGRPRDFTLSVSGARVSAGAGFVVIYTGAIMTMPGLPEKPAALDIDIDAEGQISGLF
jgi:formate--tetrahydrofolate ligase